MTFIELTMVSGKRILIRKEAITEVAEENDRYMLDKGAGCFVTVGQNVTHVTEKYDAILARLAGPVVNDLSPMVMERETPF